MPRLRVCARWRQGCLLVFNAVPFRQVDPTAHGCYLARGIIGDFEKVFLLREFGLLLDGHVIVETFLVQFEHVCFGDLAEGEFVAGALGPDCHGAAGELGGVGRKAGGEGERHFFLVLCSEMVEG